METIGYRHTAVMLAEDERYNFTTPTGAIKVDEVRFSTSSFKIDGRCSVEGWAVNRDGKQGLVRRRTQVATHTIKTDIVDAAYKSMTERVPREF